MITAYEEFITEKTQLGGNFGFEPIWLPDFLFDYQRALLEWLILKGRGAIFADCGLGKTPMELVWCENIRRKTNKPTLLIMPLAVALQTIKEAEKFGIEAHRSYDGKPAANITIANYEQLHKFNPEDYGGAACDESSILKSFDGARKQEITIFMRKMKYRSLWTATAAPNDYLELGTSSEALGYLGHMDMLGKYFKNDSNQGMAHGGGRGRFVDQPKWRFKGHAEKPFWRWVCSWARALRKPSDLGFDDANFILPELIETQHIVSTSQKADGYLFALPANGLKEQRDERRRSIQERCEKAAELATHKKPVLICCTLNDEGDLMDELVKDAVQVSGGDSDVKKEEAFRAFLSGQARGLISKAKIIAWGLNFQHCSNVVSFPSNSFEQYYQFVRRCWRFGQKNKVHSDIVASEGELNILKNLQRKQAQSDAMFSNLVAEMNQAISVNNNHNCTIKEKVPSWLKIK